MTRVELRGTWKTAKDSETTRAAIATFAAGNGMKPTAESSDEELVFKGGSQVAMRLLGGWFVKPTRLPRRAEVRLAPADRGTTVEAKISDTMGVGVMDPKLKQKYDSYCEAWIAGLGRELEG